MLFSVRTTVRLPMERAGHGCDNDLDAGRDATVAWTAEISDVRARPYLMPRTSLATRAGLNHLAARRRSLPTGEPLGRSVSLQGGVDQECGSRSCQSSEQSPATRQSRRIRLCSVSKSQSHFHIECHFRTARMFMPTVENIEVRMPQRASDRNYYILARSALYASAHNGRFS